MLYTLKQGPTERVIIEQAMRMNRPLPDSIKDAPVLAPGLFFYLLAYNEIATCRKYIDGEPLPLDWLTIHTWCQAHGCDMDEEEDVKFHVWELDAAEREFSKSKKEGKIGDGSRHQHAQPAHPKPAKQTRPKRQRQSHRR